MIKNNRLEDFDIEYYEDYDVLKSYIENKTKDMNAEEIEEFYNKIGGKSGMQDVFIKFMTRYVLKIIGNVYSLYEELTKNETDEEIISPDDPDWGYEEDEEQENIDWTDKEIEQQEATDLDYDLEWDSDDWIIEPENQQDERSKEAIKHEDLLEYIKFLNSYTKLNRYKSNGMKAIDELSEIVRSKKINEFYNNEEFF